ncbi:hypothetical protein Ping_1436 [Psychromonas ingrahamii 37]|uniref:Uncharacterized protein n=2 Tax=Psychromonas ingrahamii TaxID=357794 RepID=A1SUT8_PSYIN|nr:hypothetical protein Ping_1436 [Psychromonas ingrahamii 37]
MVLIASTFIVACSGASTPSTSIKAYDGPVQFADAKYDCGGDNNGSAGLTDYYGAVNTTNVIINSNPELCEFVVTGNANSIDTSNGKAMPDIEYVIPRGLLKQGSPITASPLTTLIAEQIVADADAVPPVVRENISDVVTEVVNDLYDMDFANDTGFTALDLALDMEGTIKKLDSGTASKVIATNHVTNDVIVYVKANKGKKLNVKSLIKTSKALAKKVVTDNPGYPTTTTGEKVVTVSVADVEKVYIKVEANDPDPVTAAGITIVVAIAKPVPAPTGATGSTGLTGGGN